MGFRRKIDPTDEWRRKHISALVGAGLPDAIVSNHRRFLLCVQEGTDFETGWNIGYLSDDEKARLHELLSGQFDLRDLFSFSSSSRI